MNTSGGDKKEAFRKYLEKSKVVSLLTKSLTDLFEMESRPDEPIQFLAERFQKEALRLSAKAQAAQQAAGAPNSMPSAISPPQKVPGSLKIKVPIRKFPHQQQPAAAPRAIADVTKGQAGAQVKKQVNSTPSQPARQAAPAAQPTSTQNGSAPVAPVSNLVGAGNVATAPPAQAQRPPSAPQNTAPQNTAPQTAATNPIPSKQEPTVSHEANAQVVHTEATKPPTDGNGTNESAEPTQAAKNGDKSEPMEITSTVGNPNT